MSDQENNKHFKYRIISDDGQENIIHSQHQLIDDNDSNIINFDEIVSNICEIESDKNISTASKGTDDINQSLYRIANLAYTAEDLSAFYEAIHAIISIHIYAKNFFVALYDENHQSISFPYMVDIDSDISVDELATMPVKVLNNTLTGYMLRTGKLLHADEELMQTLTDKGEVNELGALCHEWLGMPLKRDSKILGAIVIQSYDKNIGYSLQDIDLFTFVSQHVASALRRIQSDEALRISEKNYVKY